MASKKQIKASSKALMQKKPQNTQNNKAKIQQFSLNGHSLTAPSLIPGLYLVATPIGHLKDITIRALETLAAASIIACEDTRTSRILLNRYGITTPLMAYHEHNAERAGRLILQKLESAPIALISDAGTPLICDPGHRLVKAALAENHPVIPIPGPSAVLTALAGAGLGDQQFYFAGFLPPKSLARRQTFESLVNLSATLVFYESPKRLGECLQSAVQVFGPDRPAVVARELTKRFESFYRGALGSLADIFLSKTPPKGEIVLLIGRGKEKGHHGFDLDQILLDMMEHMPLKQAVERTALLCDLGRRQIYERALKLQGKK